MGSLRSLWCIVFQFRVLGFQDALGYNEAFAFCLPPPPPIPQKLRVPSRASFPQDWRSTVKSWRTASAGRQPQLHQGYCKVVNLEGYDSIRALQLHQV